MLADWRTLVDQEIKDTAAILAQADKDKAIGEAVKEYSRHRPRERAHELAGTGSAYEFALPADWEDGFSGIRGDIEYPAAKRIPEYLEAEDWIVYRDPSAGLRFRLLNHTPTASEKVRFLYTVRHTVDATTDTVAVADREAGAKLAASYCARSLAAFYAQTSDPTLGADIANYRTKSQEYSALARELEKSYKAHLGIRDDGQVAAASASADLDVDLQPGGDRFYHPRRWR
jgi:hypothetical protein